MSKLIEKIIELNLMNHVLSDTDLKTILNSTSSSRYGLVNKALQKKEIIKIRRGLYVTASKYRTQKLSKFFLASRIVPHSYISLESAFSYYGWIPEHVTEVTNILDINRTKTFNNSFGTFKYYQLPVNEYEFLTRVERIEEIKNEPFFIASPLRALADYVYIRKIENAGIKYLNKSLRISKDSLEQIDFDEFSIIKKIYRSQRVLSFLKKFEEELKNG